MNFRISFSLRAFVVYFFTIALLTWLLMGEAIKRLSVMMEQATELVLIDTAELSAAMLSQHLRSGEPLQDASFKFEAIYDYISQRQLNASVHGMLKQEINLDLYITDIEGIVVYDSENLHRGENFSQWRDVSQTLLGEYGARTSIKSSESIREMVIAAPIVVDGVVNGVVAIRHDLTSLANTALIEAKTLRKITVIGVFLVTVLIFLMTRWLTNMMQRLASFADTMATGAKVPKPFFLDKRLDKLATSIVKMREQIDGKAYIEQYTHSLTHELKTPITSITAAVEFLQDQSLEEEERQHFVDRVAQSNQRMSDLVSRVLMLAKLEHQQALISPAKFMLNTVLDSALLTHEYALNTQAVVLRRNTVSPVSIYGDELLFMQAIENILDNALDFCPYGGELYLDLEGDEQGYTLRVKNETEGLIADYTLNRVFERFYSTPRPRTNKRSTGLGLSFVKEVMSLHGLSLSVSAQACAQKSYFVMTICIPRYDYLD